MTGVEIAGWDIGGANTKAALITRGTVRTFSRFCALWEDPYRLRQVVATIGTELAAPRTMGVTMTAELADCFPTKSEGVAFVLDLLEEVFPHTKLHVFTVQGTFCSPPEARRRALQVASANWRATAEVVAAEVPNAVLVDVGTTTTDLVPIRSGQIAARGRTDLERLQAGELVYTGAVRTPLCSLARSLPFRGGRVGTAAEFFAQSGDVHLWLGNLVDESYTCATPDGRGTSRSDVAGRLARMVCADPSLLDEREITDIARYFAERQVRYLTAALRRIQARFGSRRPDTVVAAGLGDFLARAAAEVTGLHHESLAERWGPAASRAAPAVAVARLLQREVG